MRYDFVEIFVENHHDEYDKVFVNRTKVAFVRMSTRVKPGAVSLILSFTNGEQLVTTPDTLDDRAALLRALGAIE